MEIGDVKITNNKFQITNYIAIGLICLMILAAIAPIIGRNVDNPNLVAYLNHNEGFLMDLAWYYYSGQKRASFQFENDYGVLILYLVGFARVALSPFVDVRPGLFVFLLRWINLIFWILALIAVRRLIMRHFGSVWTAASVFMLMTIRPAFPYLSNSPKPDPVVFFLMIIGLDYTLRMIDRAPYRNLFMAIACAALALLIKFSGIFLLPAVLCAMYLAESSGREKAHIFPQTRLAVVFPAFLGMCAIFLVVMLLFFYTRQTTGMAWYKEYGLWQSILYYRPITFICATGLLLILLSIFLWVLDRYGNAVAGIAKFSGQINRFLSYISLVFFVFIFFIGLFGFVWVMDPGLFMRFLAPIGKELFGSASSALSSFIPNFVNKIMDFDPFVLAAFGAASLFILRPRKMLVEKQRLVYYKQIILITFTASCLPCMVLGMKFAFYHMLPFVAGAVIIAVTGLNEYYKTFSGRSFLKKIAPAIFLVFIAMEVIFNLKFSAQHFQYLYNWRNDIIFDIERGWKNTYSYEVSVVSDHPTSVYLPSEYVNTKFAAFSGDRTEEFDRLITSFRPRLVYYRVRNDGSEGPAPFRERLSGITPRLAAHFDNAGRKYQRYPDSSYFIYELLYR